MFSVCNMCMYVCDIFVIYIYTYGTCVFMNLCMIWSLFSLILFSTNVLSYFITVVTTFLYNGVEMLSYCCVKYHVMHHC